MEKTITKTKRLLILFLALACFATIAQTNTTEKTTQQKDECEELKKWYDEGSIIIEGHVMESKWIETGENDAGYWCCKVKINKLFKGKLNAGYFNLFLRYPMVITTADISPNHTDIVGFTGKSVFKIRPTKLTKEGYATENKGVYATEGTKAFGLEDEGFELSYKTIDGKKVLANSTEEFYKNFYSCTGTKENTTAEEKKVQ